MEAGLPLIGTLAWGPGSSTIDFFGVPSSQHSLPSRRRKPGSSIFQDLALVEAATLERRAAKMWTSCLAESHMLRIGRAYQTGPDRKSVQSNTLPLRALLWVCLVQSSAGLPSIAAEGARIRPAEEEPRIVRKLEALGGRIFKNGERVVEVKLDRTQVTDEDLKLVAVLPEVTDLSLEQTQVGDTGMSHLKALAKLEWLNLFGTQVGDNGLKHLKELNSLKHLPIGHTRVTDAGMIHIEGMTQLLYLGLRGNAVTDVGLKHLRTLKNLTGLHLGETKITDEGVKHLQDLTRLQKLWLHNTQISDRAIAFLANMKDLKELYIYETHISNEGIKRLQAVLPNARIVNQQ